MFYIERMIYYILYLVDKVYIIDLSVYTLFSIIYACFNALANIDVLCGIPDE